MFCKVPATIHNTDVIVVSYIQSSSIRIHYNSVLHSPIFYSTYNIQHVQKANEVKHPKNWAHEEDLNE